MAKKLSRTVKRKKSIHEVVDLIQEISSYQHHLIKRIRQLYQRKYREKYRQYLIEGIRIVDDALQGGAKIEYILFCDALFRTESGKKLFQTLSEKNLKIYRIPDKLFRDISDTHTPQGIMAILSYQEFDYQDIIDKSQGFLILLDRIQDPGNLGTIIRAADAAGADAVLMSKGCVDLYNLKAIRATMGSGFHFPVLQDIGNTQEIICHLKENGFKIISTDLNARQYYYQIDYHGKIVIVIGNEANGILPEVRKYSDSVVKIPILGKAESLNASIAASIVMYEAVKQRHSQKILKS